MNPWDEAWDTSKVKGASPFDAALAAEGVSGPVADIARSIYTQESSSGKNTKTSNRGAVGGMQILPGTFASVADKGWDIGDHVQNARAGIRYLKQGYDAAGGDPALTGAFYYGGPGGLEKARKGIAVSDPLNPNAPNTLQYGQQVAARLPKDKGMLQRGVEAVIPSAQAAELPSAQAKMPWDEEWAAPAKTAPAAPVPSVMDKISDGAGRIASGFVQGSKDLAGGAVRGAGSIGATLLAPGDYMMDKIMGDRGPNVSGLVTGQQPLSRNEERRNAMTQGLKEMGVNTDSLSFGAGKLGGEIAGTAGVGPVLATAARGMGAAPTIVNALRTGGMTLGQGAAPGVGNALTRIAGGAVTGAASAGLVNPEDAATGAMIGAALPAAAKTVGAAGNALGRAISGGQMAPEVQALASRAKALGIDIPADRLVNSKPLNALATSLDYVPGSGRAATMEKMEDQLNTALSKTFGQNSPNVTQALRKAGDDLGTKFETVLQNNKVRLDPQFATDLADAGQMASKELGTDGAKIINNQIDEILAKAASGDIDGQAAYNIKKTLDRIGKRNSPEAYYALDLKGKLMDALNRSLGPQEAEAFKTVRQQYGNMLSLEKLAQNGAEGGVSIGRLANLKNINNPELQELADISAQFLKSREGAHGAAQRVVAGGLALGLGGPAGLAAGLATGRGANMLLNSTAVKNRMLSSGTNALAGPGAATQLGYRAAPLLPADR